MTPPTGPGAGPGPGPGQYPGPFYGPPYAPAPGYGPGQQPPQPSQAYPPYPTQPAAAEPLVVPAEVRAGLVTVALLLAVAAPLGLLWAAVRPALDTGAAAVQESLFDRTMTADVRLLLIGLGAGAVAGVVAWLGVRRHRDGGVGCAVGLAVGGVLAMLLAAQVGRAAAHPDRLKAHVTAQWLAHGYDFTKVKPGDQALFLDEVRFENRAPLVAGALPVGGCAVLALLTGVSDRPRRPRAIAPAPAQPAY